MAVLAGIIIVVVAMVGIIALTFPYMEGRDDGDCGMRTYDNQYSGLMSLSYDLGFNSIATAEERKRKNLEANRARRLKRAQREDASGE